MAGSSDEEEATGTVEVEINNLRIEMMITEEEAAERLEEALEVEV